jgi:hypothetical protein
MIGMVDQGHVCALIHSAQRLHNPRKAIWIPQTFDAPIKLHIPDSRDSSSSPFVIQHQQWVHYCFVNFLSMGQQGRLPPRYIHCELQRGDINITPHQSRLRNRR